MFKMLNIVWLKVEDMNLVLTLALIGHTSIRLSENDRRHRDVVFNDGKMLVVDDGGASWLEDVVESGDPVWIGINPTSNALKKEWQTPGNSQMSMSL